MDNKGIVESLVRLNIDSNERIGRVNEIVCKMTEVAAQMSEAVVSQNNHTQNLLAIFDKHVTEIENNRDLIIKECQQLRSHCDKLTDMMERCQKMQEKCLNTIAELSHHVNHPQTSINIGDDNTI